MADQYRQDVDAYWRRQARVAYLERREAVRAKFRQNGGVMEPWMRYQITGDDLAKIWARGPF